MADPWEYRAVGNTGLRVTALGFGAASIGGLYEPVPEERADATIRHAYDLGIRYFDVAPIYGYGNSESRLGRGLARNPRDSFVLSTKVGRLLRADAPPDPGQSYQGTDNYFYKGVPAVNPMFDFSYDGVMKSVEESLARLGLSRVDILYIHDPDDHWQEAIAGAYPALERLRSEGVVRAIGAGMNQAEMLARFVREADIDIVLCAGRYTLLDHAALAELLPLCEERGVGVVIGGVMNSGLLANPVAGARFDYVPAPPELIDRAQDLDRVCQQHGIPLKAAALQFPLAHPAIVSVVAGVRSVDHLDDTVDMLLRPIPSELWDDLRKNGLLPDAAPTPGSADRT